MRQFGLLGYPLTHSFSENYFNDKFLKEQIADASYKSFPLENLEYFPGLCVYEKNLSGLNVTIPYKQEILPYLDTIDPEAERIGAVNTIKFTQGKKIGYNTDVYGFESSLMPMLENHHRFALVLGTGGASKAVVHVLNKLGIDWKLVSSSKLNQNTLSYNDIDTLLMKDATLIINTTPLGMFPDISGAPEIPYSCITAKHLCYDLIYNPEETTFLKLAKQYGAATKNGLEMLHLQAEKSWHIWNTP